MVSKNYSDIYNLIVELYPICRSITGNGLRQTLKIIKKQIPISIHEIPTGTKVFDWTIPKEWNIQEAYIEKLSGEKVIDFKNSNLHVVNYSSPINEIMKFNELKKHLFTIPEHPNWIPYRTTYYKKDWGFCLSHNDFLKMQDNEYKVVIDSELSDGTLTYGEFYKSGIEKTEVLFSTHVCHPSMCNDNLSGISVLTNVAKYLQNIDTKYSYRLLFIPATIGAITWLSINEKRLKNIKYGLVLALLGDDGKFNYKKSRDENAIINKIVQYLLDKAQYESNVHKFTPYGYDERQFCSPGINLPIGSLMRTPNKQFPEYHTSADNLEFIKDKNLNESENLLENIINTIENNNKYLNLFPKCEPQLGKRGLYNSVAGNIKDIELSMLWILNYSDGENDLIDISIKSGIDLSFLNTAANLLEKHKIIKKLN